MTKFGWDVSDYDWKRGPVDLHAAKQAGVSFTHHKIAEGHHDFEAINFQAFINRAQAADFPVVGSYFVNHPGTVNDQADWWVELVNKKAPWWRSHPCFTWHLDGEKFDYMPRKPYVSECNALIGRLVNEHGVDPDKVIGYLPAWLYTESEIATWNYKWAASNYSQAPSNTEFKAAYPGDNSSVWHTYGGKTPTTIQYTDSAIIAGQGTCDADAARVTTDEELQALFGETNMPLDPNDPVIKNILAKIDAVPPRVWDSADVDIIQNVQPDGSVSSVNPVWKPAHVIQELLTNSRILLNGVTLTPNQVAKIVTAVASKFPPGGVTDAQITAIADAIVAKIEPVSYVGTMTPKARP